MKLSVRLLPALRSLPAALPAALLLCGSALTASAEITPWAVTEGGRMRMVVMPQEPDGTMRGALQIEPAPGWITYWREPGDAGIPPRISFSNPSVTLSHMGFPPPKRIDNGKLRDLGYDRAVDFPFELKMSAQDRPVDLTASVFIGLCRNICLPFNAEFSLRAQAAKGTPAEEAMIVNAARSSLPKPPGPDFTVLHHAMAEGHKTLKLTLRLPSGHGGTPQVIVTGPEGHVFMEGVTGRRDGSTYMLDMPIGKLPRGYDMKGKQWGILVIAGGRAMETTLSFD